MFDNIRQRWSTSGNGIRVSFIVAVLVIVLLFGWLVAWTSRDNYQVLFSDLDPQDAGAMVSELEKLKVAYRIEEGGKSILVDKDAVYKTRLKLMGKGVNLRGTVGFEIFNSTDFGTTEFAQKINYQRALQGELARTIMDFEEIKFARVHLVMPESGLFKKNNVKPKASISLVMKGDSQLSAEQVTGIQRLVAASVPEIDASAVTILDQRGVALTRTLAVDGEAEQSNGRLDAKKKIENYLTRKVADMLDKAVGPGQAIVSIDAALTQDHVKITREEVIPLSTQDGESMGSVVRRRQAQQGSSAARDNDTPAAALTAEEDGVPVVKKPAARARTGGTVEIEYQNGRQVEQSVSTPGSIQRLSVGIFLPNNIPADRLEKIREVVSMAAGIDAQRGDSIAIYSIEQFTAKAQPVLPAAVPAEVPPVRGSAVPARRNDGIAQVLLAVLAAIGMLGLLLWLFRARQNGPAPDAPVPQLSDAEREEALTHVRQWISGETPSLKIGADR
ncbi:MAG: flagellar basal-body MS-ring/collar protein FliF [Pseudomonadota bacterium]